MKKAVKKTVKSKVDFSDWLKTNKSVVKRYLPDSKTINRVIKLESLDCGYGELINELRTGDWEDDLIFDIIGLYIYFLQTQN